MEPGVAGTMAAAAGPAQPTPVDGLKDPVVAVQWQEEGLDSKTSVPIIK